MNSMSSLTNTLKKLKGSLSRASSTWGLVFTRMKISKMQLGHFKKLNLSTQTMPNYSITQDSLTSKWRAITRLWNISKNVLRQILNINMPIIIWRLCITCTNSMAKPSTFADQPSLVTQKITIVTVIGPSLYSKKEKWAKLSKR